MDIVSIYPQLYIELEFIDSAQTLNDYTIPITSFVNDTLALHLEAYVSEPVSETLDVQALANETCTLKVDFKPLLKDSTLSTILYDTIQPLIDDIKKSPSLLKLESINNILQNLQSQIEILSSTVKIELDDVPQYTIKESPIQFND